MYNDDNNNTHHWVGLEPNTEKYFGFIYLITEKSTGKKYIGKKAYHSTRRIKVKGRRNRKVVVKPNKWEYYTGSCKPLNERINKDTLHDFEFKIISQFEAKGDLYYEEIYQQVMRGVMVNKLDNGEKEYYNGNINGIKFIPPNKGKEVLDGG